MTHRIRNLKLVISGEVHHSSLCCEKPAPRCAVAVFPVFSLTERLNVAVSQEDYRILLIPFNSPALVHSPFCWTLQMVSFRLLLCFYFIFDN